MVFAIVVVASTSDAHKPTTSARRTVEDQTQALFLEVSPSKIRTLHHGSCQHLDSLRYPKQPPLRGVAVVVTIDQVQRSALPAAR